MINEKNDVIKKKFIQYENGFIKNNRMKCYRMLNDDIVFQEKKLERLLKRNQLYNNTDINKDTQKQNIATKEEKNIINNNTPKSINENNSDIEDNINKEEPNENISFTNINKLNCLNLNYLYGFNYWKPKGDQMGFNYDKNMLVYHKRDKWIGFPNSDCIIIEKYSFQKKQDRKDNNNQKILNEHKNKSYIKSIRLSFSERILYFYTTDNYLIFYKYNLNTKNFSYISEHLIKYNSSLDEFIVEQNEIYCFILYDNYNLLVLDYEMDNELINIEVNFLQKNQLKNIKFNKFTDHRIEFCIYSKENFSTYLFDGKSLQLNEVVNTIEFNNNYKEIICLDYLPPFSDCILLCLIICFNNRDVFIVNLTFKEVMLKYKVDFKIYDVIASPFYINFISDEKLVYYDIPNLNSIKFQKIKDVKLISNRNKKEIKHDSKVVCYDIDTYTENIYALIFTEKGTLYIDNYMEKKKKRLNSFLHEDQYINQCLILKKINNEDLDINKNEYYLITSHSNGLLKIYEIPSYEVKYEFQMENDEITFMIQIVDKLYFLVFYKSGFVRCFDLYKGQSTGIVKINDIIKKDRFSTTPHEITTYIKNGIFYPDGKFFIGVESYENNLQLFTIMNIEPFELGSKQVPFININSLTDIILNSIEPYITFLVTNNNNEVFVYERKYCALINTYNLENDTPVFQKKDYMDNSNIYNDNDKELYALDENKTNQNVCYYGFNTNQRERHYLSVYNYKSNCFILRDTKAQKTLNVIKLNEPIFSIVFFNHSQEKFIFINNSEIKIYGINIKEEKIYKCSENHISMIKDKNDKKGKLILSEDENIISLINGNCFNIYSLKKE